MTHLDAVSDMADNVQLFDPATAHAADTEYFVRRGMNKGYQLFSFLAPPVYVAFAVSRYGRSHITVNRLLRATWVGGAGGTWISSALGVLAHFAS